MASAVIEKQSSQRVIADYISITKPRIVVLVVLTTWAAMWVAAKGAPSLDVLVFTLIGTALAVGSAHTLNAYIERDRDGLMERTKDRPLPTGRMKPESAMLYGIVLGAASFVIMASQVNLYSAFLAQAALLFYVFVYTAWLKPITPWNTVVGGVAGAIPPLVGWAAVTNHVALAAFVMFTVMVLWQPPHFFALTLYVLDDYRRADFPMLPVVRGQRLTLFRIALYTMAMVVVSMLLYPLGVVGLGYLTTAIILGGIYIVLAVQAVRRMHQGVEIWAKRLFFYSMLYLAGIFIAMVIDYAP